MSSLFFFLPLGCKQIPCEKPLNKCLFCDLVKPLGLLLDEAKWDFSAAGAKSRRRPSVLKAFWFCLRCQDLQDHVVNCYSVCRPSKYISDESNIQGG